MSPKFMDSSSNWIKVAGETLFLISLILLSPGQAAKYELIAKYTEKILMVVIHE